MCENGTDMSKLSGIFNLTDIKESLAIAESLATTALMTSPAAKRRLMARKLEMGLDSDLEFVPPKQVLLYLVRMGSFSSTAKIENTDSADDDVCETFHPTNHSKLLNRCREEIQSMGRPPLLDRKILSIKGEPVPTKRSFLRMLQWNILSQSKLLGIDSQSFDSNKVNQETMLNISEELFLCFNGHVFCSTALGVSNDNFVKTPPESLDWRTRRFYILQEIIQNNPDVICLEEVDHFKFLESALKSIGYAGKFFPKPDSPCLYVEGNNGPDGAALFYRTSKFELMSWATRILEVWHVQSNQVGLSCILKEKETRIEFCVAVTHLKAKSGALLTTLRDHQGRDLLNWLEKFAGGRPIIIGGDFNAEPSELVYRTLTNHRLNLKSAYCVKGREPPYTTWKIREEGEICHTIDYVIHSDSFSAAAVLDFPDEKTIGPGRVPSLNYPSDHFSLLIDFDLKEG
ncbi:hypothetical protein RUM43_002723 [Polyplax serrata]|uniref:Nocturnin n=1 Tax=Polyplax serrata TaxID=468196 RepID=A0AAN8NZI2_POLSC